MGDRQVAATRQRVGYAHLSLSRGRKVNIQVIRTGAEGGPGRPGPLPIDMLGPPINKLNFLKTAAFVLNFKLYPSPPS